MTRRARSMFSGFRTALMAGTALAMVAGAASAQSGVHDYNIPAESAGDALNAFARQSGMRILFPYDFVAGKQTRAVAGSMSEQAALQQLLQDTGLIVVSRADGVITLGAPHAASAAAEAGPVASDEPSTVAEVVVTGLRRSLNAAQETKRNSANVVDSIVAEDVGKFPDITVGDSLQRVPGVQVTRNNDQVVGVNIRGLPNVETTLNGEEIFTTSGRTFAFQNLPAEILSKLDVYKSSSADLIEGGVAGLIDVQTHRPFDFKGLEIAGSVGGEFATVADSYNPRVNLLVSDRWNTPAGEFGALVNVSYTHDDYFYPIVWEDTPHNPEPPSALTGQSKPLFVPFMGSVSTVGGREYPEANASFQFKPNDNLEFYTDLMYTGYDARYANVNFFSVTSDPHPLSNVTLAPGGCVTLTGGEGCQVQTATVTNPYTASSNQAFDEHEDDYHASIGMKYHEGPWHIDSAFTGTISNFDQVREIVDMNLNNEITTLNSNVNGHGVWNLSGPSPTVAANYYLQNLNESWQISRGSEIAWKTDVQYDLGEGFIKSIQGGLRFADRISSSAGVAGGDVGECVPGATPGSCNDGKVSALSVFGPSFFQMFQGGDGNPGHFLSESTNYLLDNAKKVRAFYGAALNGPPEDPASVFNDREFTSSLYLQAKYGFNAGPFPVDGQIGGRLVNTSRTLSGTDVTNIAAVTNTGTTAISVNGQTIQPGGVITAAYAKDSPYRIGTNETTFLPNVQARIHWSNRLLTHLSIAKTISRPGFGALNPALSITPPTVNRQGNGSEGNPNLADIRSTAYDATLEYYFRHGGYVSGGVFYHDVSGYIEPETVTQPYSASYCTAQGIPTTGGLGGQCNVIIGTSASSGHGYIRGFEASGQKFFDFLPGPLSGLGAELNYTWIESRAPIPGQNGLPTIEGQLTNVSKNNFSAIALYEKYGVSARLAATYRSKYIESYYPGNDTYPPIDVVKPTTYLDFNANYNINPQVYVQIAATNLLHAYYNSYSGTTLFPRDIRTVDSTYMVSLHFRLH